MAQPRIYDFVGWLRARNAALPMRERGSFRGLDLYNLGGSICAERYCEEAWLTGFGAHTGTVAAADE